MASEDTIYDKEKSPIRENNKSVQENKERREDKPSAKKTDKSFAGKAALGVGAGVVLGSVASFVTANAATTDDVVETDDVTNDSAEYADEHINVATSVSDEMSFSNAFEAAREEVGPGGAFEWRGNVYSTFTAEEWNGMSQEEKEEYNSHFSWSNQDNESSTASANTDNEPGKPADNEPGETDSDGLDNTDDPADTGDDASGIAEPDDAAVDSDNVEILGVYEDPETGSSIGSLIVDGQEVILVDVDGDDGNFDYMAADLDHDGVISDAEVLDISTEQVSVSEFENNSMGNDALYAMDDDTADYINDADDDCCMA